MSYARRTDANSRELVAALRKLGVTVIDMQKAAQHVPGFPDLLCIYAGDMHLVELKTLKGVLTDDQMKFHLEWNGPPIYTLRTLIDVESWVNRMRTRAFTGV